MADAMEKMCLAEADARMEIKRIVDRLAVLGMGDPVCRRMGEGVGTTNDEALESEA
jgi:hypothetical protein